MKKTWLITRQELINTFRGPSFIIFAFGLPVLAILVFAGIRLFQGRSPENREATSNVTTGWHMQPEGYIDQSGLVHVLPEDLPKDHLIAYESEGEAKRAMNAGKISAYYVIPPDYLKTGKIFYVYPDTRSYLSDGQEWVMKWTLLVNLLDGDMQTANLIWNPVWNLEEYSINQQPQAAILPGEDCSRPGFACESNDLVRYMPAIMVAIFCIAFMVSSSMLFNSVGNEKENRTIEVLMLSINPRQMLAGKTLGLGIAGLIQTTVWLCTAYILFNGGTTLSLPENFTFPIDILLWGLVFFLGGYALYASLMAGAGALVPRMKEAGIANFIAAVPLMIGYVVGLTAPLAGATNAALPVFLSFFPLTAPVVMVMRLTDSLVPLWQLLLSAALTYISAYLALRTVAAMFHAQNLLAGQPFSIKRYVMVLLGST